MVERNLVKIEDIETANGKLIEIVVTDQPQQSTILGILYYDMKIIKEDEVLHHVVETDGVGLVDLRDYDVPDDLSGDALDKLLQEEFKVSAFQCLVAKARALNLSPFNVAQYRVSRRRSSGFPRSSARTTSSCRLARSARRC